MKQKLEKFIKCVKREIGYRKRVYPCLIWKGRMTKDKANEEIATMQELYTYLETELSKISPEQKRLFE